MRSFSPKAAPRDKITAIVAVVSGQVLVAVASLASIRLYTELLTPSEFGKATLAQGVLTLFDSAAILALNQTLISQAGARESEFERRAVSISLARRFARWSGCATCLILAFVVTLVAVDLVEAAWIIVALLLAIYVPAESLKTSKLVLLLLAERHLPYSRWIVSDSVLPIFTTGAALLLWRPDAVGFITGYISGRVASTLLQIVLTDRFHLKRFLSAREDADWKSALAYGLPVAGMGPLGWIATYTDRYFIAAFLGPTSAGLFVATAGLAARPYSLLTAVLTNYFRPKYYSGNGDTRHQRLRLMRAWVLTAFALGSSGVLLFGVLGTTISTILLAPEYRDGAAEILILVAISQTFSITLHAVDNAVLATGRSGTLLAVQSVLTVLTLVAIPIGIAVAGFPGAIAGRCIAELTKLICVTIVATRITTSQVDND